MQNREPTPGQEGRVLITPESGGAPFYATIAMADNPTQPGTPWSMETVLQAATATALGLTQSDPTPDNAFLKIANVLTSLNDQIAGYEPYEIIAQTDPLEQSPFIVSSMRVDIPSTVNLGDYTFLVLFLRATEGTDSWNYFTDPYIRINGDSSNKSIYKVSNSSSTYTSAVGYLSSAGGFALFPVARKPDGPISCLWFLGGYNGAVMDLSLGVGGNIDIAYKDLNYIQLYDSSYPFKAGSYIVLAGVK